MSRKGYVDFVKEMLLEEFPGASVDMINRGIPGDTSEGGLFRLREDVLDYDPDLVFIQFALNDAYLGLPSGRFQNNIESIIKRIKLDTSAEILLITSVPVLAYPSEDRLASEFYEKIIESGEKEGLPVARVHEYWKEQVSSGLNNNMLVQADNVHPTVEGYRVMAEAVMHVFRA